jgi:hypothetical protein
MVKLLVCVWLDNFNLKKQPTAIPLTTKQCYPR